MSTPFNFGEEPCGYTYQAENYPARGTSNDDDVLVALLNGPRRTITARRREDVIDAMSSADSTEVILRRLAEKWGIEYDDLRSFDSDDFPKPIYAEQLSCSDLDWAPDLAPGHYWVPWMAPEKDQTCGVCGLERITDEEEADRG